MSTINPIPAQPPGSNSPWSALASLPQWCFRPWPLPSSILATSSQRKTLPLRSSEMNTSFPCYLCPLPFFLSFLQAEKVRFSSTQSKLTLPYVLLILPLRLAALGSALYSILFLRFPNFPSSCSLPLHLLPFSVCTHQRTYTLRPVIFWEGCGGLGYLPGSKLLLSTLVNIKLPSSVLPKIGLDTAYVLNYPQIEGR